MVQKTKLYLLESYLPDMSFNNDATTVALTPAICYILDREGIKYSIIEDYYSPHDLLPSREYLNLCDQWLDKLDAILYDNVQEIRRYNLKLTKPYGFYFRHRVLDQLFAKCYAVNKMLEALQPSEVVLSTHHSDGVSLDFTFHSVEQSYYSQIIPSICNRHNIPLQQFRAESPTRLSPSQAILPRLSHNNSLQHMRFIAKYLASPTTHKSSKRLNIFLPKNTHIGLDFIVDAIKHGHRVYGLNSTCQSIVKYSPLGANKYCPLNMEYPRDMNWYGLASVLETTSLIYWFNEQFHADISQMVLDRLKYFVLAIYPSALAFYKAISQFYKQAKIDTLLLAHDALPHESASLLAANTLGLNTVCLSHGDGVYTFPIWDKREVAHHKTIIASNTERKQYYQSLGAKNVYVSSHRFKPQLKIKEARKGYKGKNTVLYMSSFMAGDNRGLDCAYSDTWLYNLQKELVKYFKTKPNYNFVFKGYPPSDLLYNPIPKFIANEQCKNITYSGGPLAPHMKHVDRIICDVPSTGFYEAVVAGIPTMTLCHTSWICRPTAIAYFGNLIKMFSTIEEALCHIDKFLSSPASDYTRDFGIPNESILDILEHVCR